MKKTTKIFCLAFILSVLLSVFIIPTSSGYFYIERRVGGDIAEFDTTYPIDESRGIIRAHFNRYLIDEAGVQSFHSTFSHYGTVRFSTRTNSTEVELPGVWTSRHDVRVDQLGTATYSLTY